MSNAFQFRTSSRCDALNQDGCVGVATNRPGVVGIQDTVNGDHFAVTSGAFRAFTARVKSGAYDLPSSGPAGLTRC
jgi:Domain of unknown function (DUF397)